MKRRNSPFYPFLETFDAEIPPSPYIGEEKTGDSAGSGVVADLFGLEQSPALANDKPEAVALMEVLKALRGHLMVLWCERMNSAAARIGSRFVRFGFKGCPDVLGQLKDGRLLGVEVKAANGKLRPEQSIFLERIRVAGGAAFVARNCRDVLPELDSLRKEKTE